jgi:lysophospholipase L1-like esterase
VRRRLRAAVGTGLVAALVLVAGIVAAPAVASETPVRRNPPLPTYLSLGDSLGFGFQNTLAGTLPTIGYTGAVAERLQEVRRALGLRPDLTVVNLSCPGETTTSMIARPCRYGLMAPLHDDYEGSQLDAAVAYLQDRPGQVSPITVSIGANDAIPLFQQCGDDGACFADGLPALEEQLRENLTTILGTLRATAPRAEIVLLVPYNPYVLVTPASNAAVERLAPVLREVAAEHRVRVADAYAAFNLERADELCELLLFCRTFFTDIHPTELGYAALAATIIDRSGWSATDGLGWGRGWGDPAGNRPR